ncbi:MAG: lactonase family protein [Microbacterium sp.]|uniref:lactonase family protein n=1 Tax=Microbacterium sp. TaxID=51671 RepID=UPI003A884C31
MRVLVGGYTADMDGRATGIGMLERTRDGLSLPGAVIETSGSPSWVAAHPVLDIVYAAREGAGAVQAYRRTGDRSYAALGMSVPAGELVCHVAVAPDGGSLIASCWGDGRVVRMTVDATGRPSTPSIADSAADPYPVPEAERSSRAHAAAFLPDGRIATTDLGFDLVRIWRPGADLQLDHEVSLPRGSGPRHLVVHPSGHLYVVTEFTCEVFVLAPAPDGRWRLLSGTATSPAAGIGDAGAELVASGDGRFLYAGLRGTDTVATLRVRGAGESLDAVALVESDVGWPRHHLVAGDTLLVAGQRSDTVVELPLDERTGVPGRARHRVEAPSPSCLLALR